METVSVKVKVKYFSVFQDITGKSQEYIHLHDHTVSGLVDLLERQYGVASGKKRFQIRSGNGRLECMIVVNGKSADLVCNLKDNDEVMFLQPMGGG